MTPPEPYAAFESAPARRSARVRARISSARHADVPVLATLQAAARGGAEQEWAGRLTRVLGEVGAVVVVARVREEVAGYGVTVRRGAHEDGAPAGWYLMGVTVSPRWRRRGIGAELTRWRRDRVWREGAPAWCFLSARNRASLALHQRLGFTEVRQGAGFQGVTFTGGTGLLLRADPPLPV